MTAATPRANTPQRRGDTCVARMTAATSRTNIPRCRGDTCVARMTAAISQFAGTTAYTAQRNAADGSCRSGTGRHKWRPYVHRRASSRRNAAGTTGSPRRSAAISRPNIPRRRGDTCVARMTASGCRKWPAPPRTPSNAMPRTGRAVSGTGRHKWRPYVHCRASSRRTTAGTTGPPRRSAAIPRTSTPRRRGDTCVARMTAAISQFAGTTAYTAQRNATDGSCRSGTGRHKWRPYVHRRASSAATPRTPPNAMPRTGRAVSGTGRHKWRPYVHRRASSAATPPAPPARPVGPPQYRGRYACQGRAKKNGRPCGHVGGNA